MLTNYKQHCQSVVKKWIENAIDRRQRLEYVSKDMFESIVLEDYQESIADYKLEVNITLDIRCDKGVVAGSTDKQGEIVYSQEEYQKAIDGHLANERDNPQHFKDFVNALKVDSWYFDDAKIQNGIIEYKEELEYEKILNKNIHTILYKHTCHECKGSAKQKCDECKGQGEIRCSKCAGRGEYRCPECNGRGEVECDDYGCRGGKCIYCNGRGYRENGNKCWTCKGSGECQRCNGKGSLWCGCGNGYVKCHICRETGYVTCPTCEGETTVTCETCKGTNNIIEIANIKATITGNDTSLSFPDDIDEQMKQIIENNPDGIWGKETRTLTYDEKQKRVVETYQIQVPFARYNITLNDEKFACLTLGLYSVYSGCFFSDEEEEKILQALKAMDTQLKENIKLQENTKEQKQTQEVKNLSLKIKNLFLSFGKKPKRAVKILLVLYIIFAIIMGLLDSSKERDTEILGNYSFSSAMYGNIDKKSGVYKATDSWQWNGVPNDTYLQISNKALKAFNGCSIFTTTYQIKKSDKAVSGKVIVLDSVSIQKQPKCDAQNSKMEKEVFDKIFVKNSEIFYHLYDSKKIRLELQQEGRYFSIFAIKDN